MSADLITNTSIKKLVDYHRSKACGLTVLLNKPITDLKSRITPGQFEPPPPPSPKYLGMIQKTTLKTRTIMPISCATMIV